MQNVQHDILSHIFSYTEIETKDLASVSKKWDAATKRSMVYLFPSYERSESLKPYTDLAKQQIQTIDQNQGQYLEIQRVMFVFKEIMKQAQEMGYQKEPINMQTLSPAHLEEVLKWMDAQNLDLFASRVHDMDDFLDGIKDLPLLERAKEIAIEMEKRKTKLEQIQALNLNGLNLNALPKEIKYFSGLQELGLARNQLKTLSKEIGFLTQLKLLDLGFNQLKTLSKEIGFLTQLRRLILYNNQLTTLPKEIGSLTRLQWLFLGKNALTALPSEIGSLSQLTNFMLYDNQLTTLPKEIGSLTRLKTLDLHNNKQSYLPVIAKYYFILNVFWSTIEDFANFFKYKTEKDDNSKEDSLN